MSHTPLEKLLKETKSVYKLVILASKRTLEISEGAPQLVETDSPKPAIIALKEISEGKVNYKRKDSKK